MFFKKPKPSQESMSKVTIVMVRLITERMDALYADYIDGQQSNPEEMMILCELLAQLFEEGDMLQVRNTLVESGYFSAPAYHS